MGIDASILALKRENECIYYGVKEVVMSSIFVKGRSRLSSFICKINDELQMLFSIKGTVMQIEKPIINDRLRVSKVFWKHPTIYSFAVIYPWNLLFS